MRHTASDIESLADDLANATSQWLRRHGWEYTCQTPGSMWLWQKKLPDGRVALVDESTAFSFEESLMSDKEIRAEFGEPVEG